MVHVPLTHSFSTKHQCGKVASRSLCVAQSAQDLLRDYHRTPRATSTHSACNVYALRVQRLRIPRATSTHSACNVYAFRVQRLRTEPSTDMYDTIERSISGMRCQATEFINKITPSDTA
jgi:hypothetical protein